jgi:hypothetical protein
VDLSGDYLMIMYERQNFGIPNEMIIMYRMVTEGTVACINIISEHSQGRTEKNYINLKVAGALSKFQTRRLLNIKQDKCQDTTLMYSLPCFWNGILPTWPSKLGIELNTFEIQPLFLNMITGFCHK